MGSVYTGHGAQRKEGGTPILIGACKQGQARGGPRSGVPRLLERQLHRAVLGIQLRGTLLPTTCNSLNHSQNQTKEKRMKPKKSQSVPYACNLSYPEG